MPAEILSKHSFRGWSIRTGVDGNILVQHQRCQISRDIVSFAKMKFISTCPECQRLWREYSSATTAHIKLESKFNIAAISHDESTVIRLTPDVEDAARARAAARQLIRAHEAVAHPQDQSARDAARA